MSNAQIAKIIYLLREVLRIQDLEVKNCALESIIDSLEELLIKNSEGDP